MAVFPDGIASRDELRAVYIVKSKNYDEERVSAKNPDALSLLVE